MAAKTS